MNKWSKLEADRAEHERRCRVMKAEMKEQANEQAEAQERIKILKRRKAVLEGQVSKYRMKIERNSSELAESLLKENKCLNFKK
jgi:hypothetical protein